jgi:hypothetical protein
MARQAGSCSSCQPLDLMPPISERIRNALLLTLPVWGLILGLGLLSLLAKGSQTPGEPVIVLGMLAPLIGAVPIYRSATDGPVAKVFLFLFYYAACVFIMFVVGWASLSLFGLVK